MEYNDKHIVNNDDYSEDDFLNKVEISYSKSKDEIWNQLSNKIEKTTLKKHNGRNKIITIKSRIYFSIAATLLLLLGTYSILRYYTTTVNCPAGKHLNVNLPDGSTVTLNSNSTITYYPLWWKFSRKSSLSGEAFFTVKKGINFIVTSPLGNTTVLGTSFNIYSRNDKYKVTCFTGKVRVESVTSKKVILNSNYQAEVIKNGEIKVNKSIQTGNTISWINDMFNFTSVSLTRVFDEIERQYGVTITTNNELNFLYTGFFSKEKPVDEVLNLICKPFGLTFVKKSERNYHIIQN